MAPKLELPNATLEKLERLSRAQGKPPSQIVAELVGSIEDPTVEKIELVEPPPKGKPGRRLQWTRDAVLEYIDWRYQAGKPLDSLSLQQDADPVYRRALKYWGSWYVAVEAAGVPVPEGKLNKPLIGLRRIRLQRGFTQRYLAERTGLSQGYLSELENGKYGAAPETVALLVTVLATKPHELYLG